MKRLIFTAVLTICMVGVAQADSYTDTWNPSDKYVSTSPSTWVYHTHDVTDDGFPHPWEYATSADLTVWLSDDGIFDGDEYGTVIYDGTTWDLGEIGFFSDDYGTSISTSLVGDGKLDITVKATSGDFYFQQSRLRVWSAYSTPPDPPTADAGGPYSLLDDPIMLAGLASGDWTAAAWDLDEDGVFDDAAGLNPVISTAMVESLGYAPGMTWDIGLKVTGPGGFDVSTTQLTYVVPIPGAILLGILGMGAAGLKLRKFA